jgi:CRP-like cAMP-binding protein
MSNLLDRNADNPMEMRSTPRVATSVPARLAIASLPGLLDCRLRDIGTGGACLQTLSPFPLEPLRRISLQLGQASLTLDVEGCWQRETLLERAVLTGVKFLHVSPDDLKRIREFVQESANKLTTFFQERSELGVLDLDELIDIVLLSRLREAQPGTYIFHEGKQQLGQDSIYVIVSGKVVLEAAGARQHELELEFIREGGIFGGLPLIADVPPPLSAVASSDVSLLEIDRNAFRYLERAKPSVAHRISRVVIAKSVGHLRSLIDRLTSPKRKPA